MAAAVLGSRKGEASDDGDARLQLVDPVEDDGGTSCGLTGGVAHLDFDAASTSFVTASGESVEGLDAMRTMYLNCTRGKTRPSLIVTSQTLYEKYEAYMEGKKQRINITGEAGAMADAGFEVLEFKNTPVIFEGDSTFLIDDMLFLNADFIKLTIGSGRDFKTTEFQRPENQDARVAHILFAGNVTTGRRDVQGRIIDFS